MGSATLYLKILYVNYDNGYCIIELLGEWNDCLYNDIMYLKRNIADDLMANGINKFILIGENVLNFHASDNDYYQEWFDDIEDGWISLVNFQDHVLLEMETLSPFKRSSMIGRHSLRAIKASFLNPAFLLSMRLTSGLTK